MTDIIRPSDWQSIITPSRGFYFYHDFDIVSTSNAPFAVTASGTNATGNTNYATDAANVVGIKALYSGTTNSGYVSFYTASNAIRLGGGVFTFETALRVLQLSNDTDTYTVRCGLGDVTNGSTPVDGVQFTYTATTSATNWQCQTYSNNNATAGDSLVLADTNYHRFKFIVNADASLVTYYIDDVSVYTIADVSPGTKIPCGAGRETGLLYSILNSAGTGAGRIMYIDWIKVSYIFTTARA